MPPRFRDIRRALEKLGATVTPSPGGSSHWHVEKDGCMYPLPAGHGDNSEITDKYVRGVCKALSLDEKAFRRLL